MVKVGFENRLREIRIRKGLRQADLARMIGVFQSEISEIETGKRKPSVYLAKRIAKALGVSLDDLFLA
ncbi:MAG: helix-turn-helix transcriptional regulator [Candidatus Bathyarchaeia archaeon]